MFNFKRWSLILSTHPDTVKMYFKPQEMHRTLVLKIQVFLQHL